jgi:hypothetical protein
VSDTCRATIDRFARAAIRELIARLNNGWAVAWLAVLLVAPGCTINATVTPPGATPAAPDIGKSQTAPSPSSAPSMTRKSRQPERASRVSPQQSSATFEHFKVTVQDIRYKSHSQALVKARVCVRSLPPDPQGNRTRISWDPWSVTAGPRAAKAGYRGDAPARLFPSARTYRVGQCASGWIPFRLRGQLDTIRYANFVGDRAIWDADDLGDKPVTRHESQRGRRGKPGGLGEGTFIVGKDLRPGRYTARAREGRTCYWARLKDDTGDFGSIIANNTTNGRASVTMKRSDGAFETSGCTLWSRT